jgi:hypothetical protein
MEQDVYQCSKKYNFDNFVAYGYRRVVRIKFKIDKVIHWPDEGIKVEKKSKVGSFGNHKGEIKSELSKEVDAALLTRKFKRNDCKKTPVKHLQRNQLELRKQQQKKSAIKKEIRWNMIFYPCANNSARSMLTPLYLE